MRFWTYNFSLHEIKEGLSPSFPCLTRVVLLLHGVKLHARKGRFQIRSQRAPRANGKPLAELLFGRDAMKVPRLTEKELALTKGNHAKENVNSNDHRNQPHFLEPLYNRHSNLSIGFNVKYMFTKIGRTKFLYIKIKKRTL